MQYKVGDKIVHPLHGAGVIEDVVEECVGGQNRSYYIMRVPSDNVVVMIPIDSCEAIGVRDVISSQEADVLLNDFSKLEIDEPANWNRRHRENMIRIKSGDLVEVSRVVKALLLRSNERVLSTGERKMLVTAKQILLSELVLVTGKTFEEIESELSNRLTI